jgi:PAS domain S-box-containing protein
MIEGRHSLFVRIISGLLAVGILAGSLLATMTDLPVVKHLGFNNFTAIIAGVILVLILLKSKLSEYWSDVAILESGLMITALLLIVLSINSGKVDLVYGLLLSMVVGLLVMEKDDHFYLGGFAVISWLVIIINRVRLENTLVILQALILSACGFAAMWVAKVANKNLDEKRSRERDTKLSAALKQEKLKSELLIQAISDSVVVVSKKGIIQLMNSSAQKMLGWPEDESIGIGYENIILQVDAKNQPIPAEDSIIKKVLDTGVTTTDNTDVLSRNKRKTTVSMSVAPISDTPGEIDGIIAVMRDITKEKAQERQEAEFISTASHEMRTPVAAIQGYLELALNPKVATLDQRGINFVTKARESTQRLGKLFQDLLTISKTDDGRLENHPSVINTKDFLKKIVEEERFTIKEKPVELLLNFGGKPENTISPIYYIYADELRLQEVLTNLINNAIKFTEKGSVTVDLSGTSEIVEISVADTGMGIPQEDLPHLFEKFYRVDNSATRTIGGTGLGLYISRKIIELYDGKIWAESSPGKGSKFFIHIPRLAEGKINEMQQKTISQL